LTSGFLKHYQGQGLKLIGIRVLFMELLLNLAWLLLAIPAYWLWRSSMPANRRRGFSSLQCLLALGCALVILFPVISATDDLHAMRAEMEESPVSKRSIQRGSSDKNPIPHPRLQSPPALLPGVVPFLAVMEFPAASSHKISFLAVAPPLASAGRAPPARSLA
jgi:hypothetical protein